MRDPTACQGMARAHQAGPLGEVVVDGLHGLDVVVDAGLARALPRAAHHAHARQAQPRRAHLHLHAPAAWA